MMLRCLSLGIALLGVITAVDATEPVASIDSPIAKMRHLDWQGQLQADLAYLCSDDLRGRSVTDDSIHVAAAYLAERFQQAGLDTDLIAGKPFQEVETFVGIEVGARENNHLEFRSASAPGESGLDTDGDQDKTLDLDLPLGIEMNPLAMGADRAQAAGRVIFAGYGITAPEFDYDDYANIDVRDAVVIVLRKEPGNTDPASRFDGRRNTPHAYFSTKVSNAIRHGAVGIIIVNDRASVAEAIAKIDDMTRREWARRTQLLERLRESPGDASGGPQALADNLAAIDSVIAGYKTDREFAANGLLGISEAGDRPEPNTKIPVVCVSRGAVDQLFQGQKRPTIDAIEQQLDRQQSPSSFELVGVTAGMRVELRSNKRLSNNVLGVIPGRGVLADETVILGAHYDHVGLGGYGSLAPGTIAIHNGADDNASGASALVACARLLGERLQSFDTHRRVLFVAFTAEERGLLGSAHYVRQPRFSMNSTVAMINLDMVGRLRDNELTVYGTGSGDTLDPLVEQANFRHEFNLFKVASGYGPSDHQSFYEAGIPVLFFFTGLHSDYHRPSDDYEKIDFGGMFRITEMVCDVSTQLAIATSRPARVETQKGVTIRRQLTAVLGVTLANQPGGVVLSGLSPGGAATSGGLQVGDQIERLGKAAVRSSTDVIEALRGYSPGDSLDVEILRQGQRYERRIRLQARPEG